MSDKTLDLTKPSREMDVLVADKILQKDIQWYFRDETGDDLHTAEEEWDMYLEAFVAYYSSDIAAAWLVMDKMHGRLFSVRRRFWARLLAIIQKDIGANVAWPDALMYLDARRICVAALETEEVVK